MAQFRDDFKWDCIVEHESHQCPHGCEVFQRGVSGDGSVMPANILSIAEGMILHGQLAFGRNQVVERANRDGALARRGIVQFRAATSCRMIRPVGRA
jgi:hypothetical protein